jgi:hypothetical protein
MKTKQRNEIMPTVSGNFNIIDGLEDRLRNQLRIHWKWLKETDSNNLTDFVMNIFKNNI